MVQYACARLKKRQNLVLMSLTIFIGLPGVAVSL